MKKDLELLAYICAVEINNLLEPTPEQIARIILKYFNQFSSLRLNE
jgi:hypothetical protein